MALPTGFLRPYYCFGRKTTFINENCTMVLTENNDSYKWCQ